MSEYDAALAWIDNESPDVSDTLDRDTAAVVVAAALRTLFTLPGSEIVTLMQYWSLAAYAQDLANDSLYRAVAEVDRREALAAAARLRPPDDPMPPPIPTSAAPPSENVSAPVVPIATSANAPPVPAKTKAAAPSTMVEALAQKAATQSAKEAWREPVNLWADVPAPAALPLDAVPEVIRRSAQDRARRLNGCKCNASIALSTMDRRNVE